MHCKEGNYLGSTKLHSGKHGSVFTSGIFGGFSAAKIPPDKFCQVAEEVRYGDRKKFQRVVAVVEDVNQPKSVCLHVWVSCSRLVVPGAVNKGIDKKKFEAKMSSTAKCVESLARIGVIILQI